MTNKEERIGLGGGCHWCTEGVFQSLIGIKEVKQGWIAAKEDENFSEAIEVSYDPDIISAKELIEIHLHTHASTSQHSFREKYRSAVYTYSKDQKAIFETIINDLQKDFEDKLVTQVYTFDKFKINREDQLNYLYTRKDNVFCERYIHPKLNLLLEKFSNKVDHQKLEAIDKINSSI